ncbi:MAG: methyltransferase [Actinomycetota bacterium]|nr:methyltransferase [Actinomycetota bacterium]
MSALTNEAMAQLRHVLDRVGYGELFATIAGDQLFAPDRDAALRRVETLPPLERACLRLFALDEGEPDLPPALDGLLDALGALGLVEEGDGPVRLDDLVVVPVLGGYLLTATPPGWRPSLSPTGRAYLGPDSLRVARALPTGALGSILDLGTGCGIQGLLGVRQAAHRVLSDLEPRALALARLNAELNRPGEDVAVVAGDTYAPVADERFDLIVSLPPYVPALQGDEALATSGGADGADLVRRLIAGAPEHLCAGGELVFFAQLLTDDAGPLIANELTTLAPGLSGRLLCSDWHALQPYVLELATKTAAATGTDAAVLHARYLTALREHQATGVCTVVARLVRPARGDGSEVAVIGPDRLRAATKLRAVDALGFVERENGVEVRRFGGPAQLLSPPAAALLRAFQAGASIDAARHAAWGDPPGADARDLLDQALERSADLVRLGLLERSATPPN